VKLKTYYKNNFKISKMYKVKSYKINLILKLKTRFCTWVIPSKLKIMNHHKSIKRNNIKYYSKSHNNLFRMNRLNNRKWIQIRTNRHWFKIKTWWNQIIWLKMEMNRMFLMFVKITLIMNQKIFIKATRIIWIWANKKWKTCWTNRIKLWAINKPNCRRKIIKYKNYWWRNFN